MANQYWRKIPLKNKVAMVLNWLNNENKIQVSYLEIALKFDISPATASQLCNLIASMYPNDWVYEDGILKIKTSEKQ